MRSDGANRPFQHPTRGTDSDQLLVQCGRPLMVISTCVR